MSTAPCIVLLASLMANPAGTPVECKPSCAEKQAPAVCGKAMVVDGDATLLTDLGEIVIDPLAFFEQLVARYRSLTVYRDITRIVQVTQHLGEEDEQRLETEIACHIEDGRLSVTTPGSQVRRMIGLDRSYLPETPLGKELERYDLWLAPHMSLRFAEDPLQDFREGVDEGFTATEAQPVTIDEKSMVHLELKSGDGLSGDYQARYDLYVDPDSMLIERIRGQQRLPDGGHYETKVEITPTYAESDDPATVWPEEGCRSSACAKHDESTTWPAGKPASTSGDRSAKASEREDEEDVPEVPAKDRKDGPVHIVG